MFGSAARGPVFWSKMEKWAASKRGRKSRKQQRSRHAHTHRVPRIVEAPYNGIHYPRKAEKCGDSVPRSPAAEARDRGWPRAHVCGMYVSAAFDSGARTCSSLQNASLPYLCRYLPVPTLAVCLLACMLPCLGLPGLHTYHRAARTAPARDLIIPRLCTRLEHGGLSDSVETDTHTHESRGRQHAIYHARSHHRSALCCPLAGAPAHFCFS